MLLIMVSRVSGHFMGASFLYLVSWFYVIKRMVMGWTKLAGIYNIIEGEESMMLHQTSHFILSLSHSKVIAIWGIIINLLFAILGFIGLLIYEVNISFYNHIIEGKFRCKYLKYFVPFIKNKMCTQILFYFIF